MQLQDLLEPLEFNDLTKTPPIPEHALLAALLENALQDLHGFGVPKTKQTKKNAREWIMNNRNREPFSFLWICDMLLLDPVSFRRAVFKR